MFDPGKFLEREAARPDGLKLYVRFGNLPERNLSFSDRTHCLEPGISVFNIAAPPHDGIVDVDWTPLGIYDDPDNLRSQVTGSIWEAAKALPPLAMRTTMTAGFLHRPAFLVTGPECKYRGCDGEPCLHWAELLAPLDRIDSEYLVVPIDRYHPLARGRTEIKIAIAARLRISSRPAAAGFYPEDVSKQPSG